MRVPGTTVGVGLAVGVLLLLHTSGLLDRLELLTVDARFALRGPRRAVEPVVIVALDDTALRTWTEPIPLWGGRIARVVRTARESGAKAVAVDVILQGEMDAYLRGLGGGSGVEGSLPNEQLSDALAEANGTVCLAYANTPQGTPIPPSPELLTDQATLDALGYAEQAPSRDGILRSGTLYRESAEAPSPFPSPADGRGGPLNGSVPETQEMVTIGPPLPSAGEGKGEGAISSSLAAAVAARAHGLVAPNADALRQLARGRADRRDTRFGINWAAPTRQIPALALLAAAPDSSVRQSLRGATVLIGFTATQKTGDLHPIPVRGIVPGVEVQGQAVSTLLDGRAVVTPALPVIGTELAALLIAAGLSAACFGGLSLPRAVCVQAGGLAAYGAFAYGMFVLRDTLLPVAAVTAAGTLVPLAQVAGRTVLERARRGQVERLFGQHVSPEVADYLLTRHDRGDLLRTGARGIATVLFVDVRGSTMRAESLPPEDALRELNDFFAAVIPAVTGEGGLVNRMLGDGLLALFGVPVPRPDPAGDALRAAWAIRMAVDLLNTRRAAAGLPFLEFGCGIHTGPVVHGNLGSPERQEYTVIGDTVNAAARLEGLTKDEPGAWLAVSVATRDAAAAVPLPVLALSAPRPFVLRGRTAPIDVCFGGE